MNRRTTRGIVAIVALLVLAGCGNEFGVTPSHPLGTFEVMDHFLTDDKGLERTERTFGSVDCVGRSELVEKLGELKLYEYREFTKSSLSKHVVIIAVDEVNIVQAIGGRFHSGRRSFSDSGSKVTGYLGSLWAEVSGGPAEFTKMNEPGGAVNEYLIATIDKGKVHGIWRKTPANGEVAHYRTLHDQVLLYID